jgi:hypothetical protein
MARGRALALESARQTTTARRSSGAQRGKIFCAGQNFLRKRVAQSQQFCTTTIK